MISCGADRVLRLYEKTEQPLVLEDEEEEEREAREGLATGDQTIVAGHSGLNLPSRKTIGSERGVRYTKHIHMGYFTSNFHRLKVF